MKQKVLQQTGLLFFSQIGLIALGLGIKYIQTGELGDFNYGEYALFVSITSISLIIFRFGFFTSIQVLLANNSNSERERNIIGAGSVITLAIGLLFALFLWIISFKINSILNTQIGPTLRSIAPLCIVLPFQYLISAISTGTNRIKVEAGFNIFPKILFLIALIVFISQRELSVMVTIILNLVSSIAVLFWVLWRLAPGFADLKKNIKLVFAKNKKYGIHYYAGSVFNQTTYRLDEIFISGFINTMQLGYYSLANLVCSPMILLSQSMSRSMFKRYANSDRIPKEVFKYNTAWLILCVIGLFAISKIFMGFAFQDYDFSSVLQYIFPLSFAFFFQGLCAPYVFLAAKSMGKEIRNVAWIEASVNIVGNIVLIQIYGVFGAIYASIIAKLIHFLALKFYYHKYLKQKGLA